MPSHYTSIGFPAETIEEIEALAMRVIDDTVTIHCPRGRYLRWINGDGAELWLQMDEDYNLIGITPFFHKKSVMNVGITQVYRRAHDSILEGAIRAWANPKHSQPYVGAFEFVCDVVDLGRYPNLALPFLSPLRVAGFAYHVEVFPSLDTFYASEVGQGKSTPEYIVPGGISKANEDGVLALDSHAEVGGRVVNTSLLTNFHSHREYYWILVRTEGGTIDLVSDPKLVTQPLVPGHIVSSYCWLCGQILKPQLQKKKSFKELFFGR